MWNPFMSGTAAWRWVFVFLRRRPIRIIHCMGGEILHKYPRFCSAAHPAARVSSSEMDRSPEKKPVHLIAAVSRERGIGKNGKLPWNLPSEFQYFLKNVTSVSRPGKMNLMVWGRACWYSNPTTLFPLPNILHVVLSKTMTTAPDHAHFVREDFDGAVRMAAEPPLADLIETIWVVGGTQVYMDALQHPWCDLLYLTDVMADFNCDVFFPEFDRELFKLQDKFPGVPSEIQEERGVRYKFQVFKRETADGV